mgnify:CR=1 FL=1|tara:strand:- start:2828 stop:3070 length:243 start_codon:yes stop_codon:yes gene_type:complete
MCVGCETVEGQVEKSFVRWDRKYDKNKPRIKDIAERRKQVVLRFKAAYGVSEYIHKRWESLPLYKRLLIRFNIWKQNRRK